MDSWNSFHKILMNRSLSKFLPLLDMTSTDTQQNQGTLSFLFTRIILSAVNSEMRLKMNTNTSPLIFFKMQSIEQKDKTKVITSRMRRTTRCLSTDILIVKQLLFLSSTKPRSHYKLTSNLIPNLINSVL